MLIISESLLEVGSELAEEGEFACLFVDFRSKSQPGPFPQGSERRGILLFSTVEACYENEMFYGIFGGSCLRIQ